MPKEDHLTVSPHVMPGPTQEAESVHVPASDELADQLERIEREKQSERERERQEELARLGPLSRFD